MHYGIYLVIPIVVANTVLSQTFHLSDINIDGVGSHSVSKWVDYDNDNDLDIFIAGRTGSSTAIAKLYTNIGGTFIDSKIQFGWFESCSADWGDYDNDGDLDLLLCGQGGDTQPVSYIYRNDNYGIFVRLDVGLPRIYESTCHWIDYDNDSKPDILLTGRTNTIVVTKLYRNLGNDVFMEVATQLPYVTYGSVAIGDYDNDGDLDLFLSGALETQEPISNIFRNDGNGRFVKIENNFPNVDLGSSAWGDYDNDGDLDLAITGVMNYDFGSEPSEAGIYRNDGNDTFVKINATIIKVYYSSLAWADYDNDGDLDILLAGRCDACSPQNRCYLYRNDGNNTFVLTSDWFFTFMRGDVDFGDYDDDGDLDILISGEAGGSSNITKVYENQLQGGDYISQNAVINPQATVDKYSVKFSWNGLKFSSTPILGQSYNIRISDSSSANNVKSPCSNIATGSRKLAKLGNIQKGTDWQIAKIEGGCYAWSVQAINHSFLGSNFSNESVFLIAPWPPSKSVPLDSAIDQPINIKLSWNIPKAADSYHLQISDKSNLANPFINTVGIIDTFYINKNLAYGSNYYWRVNASNKAGIGEWSDIWEFRTYIRAPMLLQPADSEVVKIQKPNLVWNAIPEAESYELEISWSPYFYSSTRVQNKITADTSFVFSNASNRNYFWRVRSLKGNILSAWSPTFFFSVNVEGYYPLHVGNMWQYSNDPMHPIIQTESIIADTVLGNGHTYAVYSGLFFPARFMRQVGSKILFFNSTDSIEYTLLDFAANAGDTVSRLHVDPSWIVLVGKPFNSYLPQNQWQFEYGNGVLTNGSWTIVDSIGLYGTTKEPGIEWRLTGARINGSVRYGNITSVSDQQSAIPQSTAIYQNYPNPFNPTTNIQFFLSIQSACFGENFRYVGKTGC